MAISMEYKFVIQSTYPQLWLNIEVRRSQKENYDSGDYTIWGYSRDDNLHFNYTRDSNSNLDCANYHCSRNSNLNFDYTSCKCSTNSDTSFKYTCRIYSSTEDVKYFITTRCEYTRTSDLSWDNVVQIFCHHKLGVKKGTHIPTGLKVHVRTQCLREKEVNLLKNLKVEVSFLWLIFKTFELLILKCCLLTITP